MPSPELGIWWVLTAVIGLSTFPVTARLFARWPDAGYGLGRTAGLILVGWLSWILASIGLVPQRGWTVLILIAGIGAAAWLGRPGATARTIIRERWRRIVLAEAVLLVAFLLFHLAFSLRPFAHLGERPMDLAFFSACWRSGSFPPTDPWFAGEGLNYYYFGHALMAMIAKAAAIVPTKAYPLAVATLPALLAGGLLSLFLRLLGGARSAVAAIVVFLLMGNLAALLEPGLLSGPFEMDAYLRSTQVIPGGLNEYPLFSLLVAELHAHVMALPMEVLLLCILLGGIRRPWAPAAAALVLGGLGATNPWSVAVCAILTLVALLRHASGDGTVRALGAAVATWLGILAAAWLLFLPFQMAYSPPPLGLQWLEETTTGIGDLACLFGLPLFILLPSLVARARLALGRRPKASPWTLIVVITAIALLLGIALLSGPPAVLLLPLFCISAPLALGAVEEEEEGFVWALFWMGIAVLLGCEILNVRTMLAEPDHRYNTIMRFHFEATLLLGIAATDRLVRGVSSVARGGSPRGRLPEIVWAGAAVLLLLPAAIPPVRALSAYLGSGTGSGGADLLAGPGAPGPEEGAAIRWLNREVRGQPVIVEWTGRSYDFRACRISSHTGLPTLLGWIDHVPWWNRDARDVVRRGAALEMIYGTETIEEALPYLRRWGVRYVIVGPWERSSIRPEGIGKFEALPVVFADGDLHIWRVD